ncbi:hypothetical protein GCM10027059_37240 [Myceligenerans halotolerans]
MDDELIGKRIKHLREARDITQIAVAQEAKISYSLMRKIESGERDVTQTVATAVARALHVEIATITGQPYDTEGPRRDRIHDLIPDLRTALAFWDLPPDLEVAPRPVADLVAEARQVNELRRLDRNTKVVERLPALIHEALTAFHGNSDVQERAVIADVLMTLMYGARSAAFKCGYDDLVIVVGDRIQWVAEQIQDPLMKAFGAWNQAISLARYGSYGMGLRLMERARAAIEDTASNDARLLCATGSLYLRSADSAARAGKSDDAMAYLAEARQIAAHLPEDTDSDWKNLSTFGPSNVVIHGVVVALEFQDSALALSLADELPMSESVTSRFPTRVGHHHMDLARAYLWQGEREKALNSLMNARKAAPQQTRHHPTTREVTGILVRTHRRSNESLARFAAWVGPQEEW